MFTPSLTHVLPLWLNFSLLFTLRIPQINDISFENCLFHLIIVSVFTHSWNTRTTSTYTNIIDQNKEIKNAIFVFSPLLRSIEWTDYCTTGNGGKSTAHVVPALIRVCGLSGGSRGGARGPSPPLFLDQNEAQRAEKNFFWGRGPPLISGSGWPPPPYLKTWIRHWDFLFPSVFDFMYCYFRLVHQERFLQVPVMISEVSGFGLSKCLFISTCVCIFKPLIALHNLRNAHFRLKSLWVGLIR